MSTKDTSAVSFSKNVVRTRFTYEEKEFPAGLPNYINYVRRPYSSNVPCNSIGKRCRVYIQSVFVFELMAPLEKLGKVTRRLPSALFSAKCTSARSLIRLQFGKKVQLEVRN